ncbi:zinc ABC transporter substrate-binding protein [Leucothrix arctica]|uniref:High-affinity zinc uptake system protein ZnuA n=1 Tax=Leucothrix arctica TaxID=1481894 RepID=A0A317CAW1_9GAMM|nr:zinc ABC transporter substrate-binding protein [Leucothrix arctica]PWQ93510.1 zinc transporter [Leucothrix arctica]
MRRSIVACAALLGLSLNAHAAPPSVAVDIAPLHSLVSQVMGSVAEPTLIIPAESSPHHYTLRPSQAKALASADVVFWIGEGFTPWLEKSLDNLASSAQKVEVLEIEGTTTHGYREGATFEKHEHDDEHEEEGHDDEKEHKKDEHHDEHDGNDPHAWLDPENAKIWVKHISDVLSKQDPENAAAYSSNATATIASLDAMIVSTRTQIEALGQPKFIVFHDAYQYFEKRFGISAAGSISLGDAEDPSPARVKEIQETVKKLGVNCIFTEPQYNAGLVKNVFAGTSISTIGVMDPLGASISTGSGHYQALIQAMINSISQCK